MITSEQLLGMGWKPGPSFGLLKDAIQRASNVYSEQEILGILALVKQKPQDWDAHFIFNEVAFELLEQDRQERVSDLRLNGTGIPYKTWGTELIDPGAIEQMDIAMRLPQVVAGALMADSHIGYGLPVGGVLALEGAISPGAVGPDIGCSVFVSLYPDIEDKMEYNSFGKSYPNVELSYEIKKALMRSTTFGVGAISPMRQDHSVLNDERWELFPVLKKYGLKDKAYEQLGQSGSGNHFVSFGHMTTLDDIQSTTHEDRLPKGRYLCIISHSGSRGVGYKIADHYGKIAEEQYKNLGAAKKVAPLTGSDASEYFNCMNLAVAFAHANHEVIHHRLAANLGWDLLMFAGNSHNTATLENVNNIPAFVHRKGATPAHQGVFGFIPGTMADPGYMVIGKGNTESLNSSSHGAGRKLGRNAAIAQITAEEQANYLAERSVQLIGGGLDESPQAYKHISEVMAAQLDLVTPTGVYRPLIVRMADPEVKRNRKAPKDDGE